MRMFGAISVCLSACITVSAAEPAKVSVYPVSDKPAVTAPIPTPPIVLEGTIVPVPSTTNGEASPYHQTQWTDSYRDRVVPMTTTANNPAMKDCGTVSKECGAVPCGTPLFRGTLVTVCGADVCESRGRPALLGGKQFLNIGNKECSTKTCASCESNSTRGSCKPDCSNQLGLCNGTILARIKAWICFRPCDGPCIGLFRPEPYMPANITVFPCHGCGVGSCQSAAGCGLGIGSRIGAGNCATGHCGDGSGLGGRLLAGRNCGPQDCNGAEPKLSGAPFCGGYRFATIEPRTYGQNPTRIDPIAGIVKAPKTNDAKGELKYESSKIEQASAQLPSPHPIPGSKSATKESKDVKSNPLSIPFSNP